MTGDEDLFGHSSAPLARPHDLCKVTLQAIDSGETDKAWLLTKTGGKPHHVPKSQVTRGVGPNVDVFTMKRQVAHEKGWL